MRDYQKYINALRKCAKEHENDIIFTGHTDVTALCRDTADLLEELEQDPCENCSAKHELEVNVKKWADAYKRGLEDGHKEQSCKDTVSREAAQEAVENTIAKYIPIFIGRYEKIPLELAMAIKDLPPVVQKSNDADDVLNIVFEAIDDCSTDGLAGIFCSYDDGERFKEYIKTLICYKKGSEE